MEKRGKFILAFLSGILLDISFLGMIMIPSYSVYILSFISQNESQSFTNLLYGNLLSPIFRLFSNFMTPLSGMLETRVGSIWTIVIGGLIAELSLVFIYFQQNLILFCVLIILLGIGSGLSSGIPLKNAALFYPKNKGLITSLFSTIGSLFSVIFSFLGEVIINPDKYTLKEDEKFYPKKIGENTRKYYLIVGTIEPLFLIFCIISFAKYEPNLEDEKTEKITNEEEGEIIGEENKGESEPETINPEKPKITGKMKIQKALKSLRFWRLSIISILVPFGIIFCGVTLRSYIAVIGLDGDAVRFLAVFPMLINCFMIPVWAALTDKFGFVIISKIIIIPMIFEQIFLGKFLDKPKYLVIGICLFLFSSVGLTFCFITHLMTVFGVKYYLHIGGVLGIINAFFPLVMSILSIILSNYFEGIEITTPYKIIYYISACLTVIGFIISLFETNQPFEYEPPLNDEIQKISMSIERENEKETIEQII